MPVHATRSGGTNIEDFFPVWGQGRAGPWLAHRLDRDTAGCLVIAFKKSALLAAQAAFGNGEVRKTYWAMVSGVPLSAKGAIDLPLGKTTTGKSWKMAAVDGAPSAVTTWRLRGSHGGMSWLELHPRTGRTHQIRAHCAALGHPILGDAVYGGGKGTMCLLARAISLPLDPLVAATAPVPSHMWEMLKSCGWNENAETERCDDPE